MLLEDATSQADSSAGQEQQAAEDLFNNDNLALARRFSLSLDEYLIDVARHDEETVLGRVCDRLGLPLLDRAEVRPELVDGRFLECFSMDLARRAGVVVIRRSDDEAQIIVTSRPLDSALLHEATHVTGSARMAVALKSVVLSALNQAIDRQGKMAESFLPPSESEEQNLLAEIERLSATNDLLDLANKAPVVRLLNMMLLEALRMRASDVHLHPCENALHVRFRIDGILYTQFTLPKSMQPPLVSRIKVMANLDIAEHRLPQDGRTTVSIGNRQVDVRVSVVPTADDERVVLRLLDKGARLYQLEDLGMATETYRRFDRLIRQSHGIILVTGPTGSGKTTTLYAALQRINAVESNVITIEDPIEYKLEGINQIQVSSRKGMSFASALRSVLRQDPDIIMVGEIRDQETARMAIQSALTGHLVFSTLHTNDAASAATRLVDIGVEPYLVASSVIGIMAQRLVRRICPHCAREVDVDPRQFEELGLGQHEMLRAAKVGDGCQECLQAGYLDRVGIYELMPMSDAIKELVIQSAPSNRLKERALGEGMTTLRRDGALKVLEGLTTAEEVLRVTQMDTLGEVAS